MIVALVNCSDIERTFCRVGTACQKNQLQSIWWCFDVEFRTSNRV